MRESTSRQSGWQKEGEKQALVVVVFLLYFLKFIFSLCWFSFVCFYKVIISVSHRS